MIKISKKYNKTNVKVILRWLIKKGYIIFPRSRSEKYHKEKINVFDFELSKGEINQIDLLDKIKI